MRPPSIFFSLLLLACAHTQVAAQWIIKDESPAHRPDSPLTHEQKVIRTAHPDRRGSDRKIDLIWFHAASHTFVVIDNGEQSSPAYSGLADAMRKNDCLAGVNGGFFHKDYSVSGLMVTDGKKTGKFGSGALLSGVLLSSGNRNPYILRRAEYGEKYKETSLIQTGPFLVDQSRVVKGLSPENSRRRTFAIQAADRWFALGQSDAFTLAELGEVLAHPSFSPNRKIHRALNLDGGTSSGLYFQRGRDAAPFVVEPIKRVRNFVGIVPRFP